MLLKLAKHWYTKMGKLKRAQKTNGIGIGPMDYSFAADLGIFEKA